MKLFFALLICLIGFSVASAAETSTHNTRYPAPHYSPPDMRQVHTSPGAPIYTPPPAPIYASAEEHPMYTPPSPPILNGHSTGYYNPPTGPKASEVILDDGKPMYTPPAEPISSK